MKKKDLYSKDSSNKRNLRALARAIMRMPCNRNNADKLCVYESQRLYAAYFKEVCK